MRNEPQYLSENLKKSTMSNIVPSILKDNYLVINFPNVTITNNHRKESGRDLYDVLIDTNWDWFEELNVND